MPTAVDRRIPRADKDPIAGLPDWGNAAARSQYSQEQRDAFWQQFITQLTSQLGWNPAAVFPDLNDGFTKILDALAGIELTPGGVIDAIQAIVSQIVETILAVVGDVVPVFGAPVEVFGRIILYTINQSVDAIQMAGGLTSQLQDLASKLNFDQNSSAYDAYKNGVVSVPYGSCINTTTITPTLARWNYVRVRKPFELRTTTVFAMKSAGVTGVFFDYYLMEDDGSDTWFHTSSNLVSDTDPSALTPLTYQLPADQARVIGAQDIVAVQIRMTGSGTVTLLSNNSTPDGTAGTVQPKRFGAQRDPSTTAAPVTLTAVQVDATWSAITPYVELDVSAPLPQPVVIDDDFGVNGALNPQTWANYRTTAYWPIYWFSGVWYNLIAEDSSCSYTGAADGFELVMTLHRLNMPTDACRLRVDPVGLSSVYGWGLLNVAFDWSSYVGIGVSNSSVQIATFNAYNDFGTPRKTVSYSHTDGAPLYCQYDEPTKTYTVFSDTNPSICSWTDAGDEVPVGKFCRYGGIKEVQAAGVKSCKFGRYRLEDTTVSVPTSPAPGGGGTPQPPGGGAVIGSTFPMTFPIKLSGPSNILAATMEPATASLTGVAALDAIDATMLPATASLTGVVPAAGIVSATMRPATADLAGTGGVVNEGFVDLSNWSLNGTSAATRITAASNRLNLVGATSGYIYATRNVPVDMTGRTLQFETVSAGSANHEDHFRLTNGAWSTWNGFMIYYGNLYVTVGGSSVFVAAFNPTTHKHLRMRQVGSVTYYDYSADGVNWTNATAGGTLYPITAAYVQVLFAANAAVTTTYDNLVIA